MGDATSITGPLGLDGDAAVVWGDRRLAVSSLTGDLTYDGSAIVLDQVTLTTDEGVLAVRGRVDGVLGSPRLELAYDATLDLMEVGSLLGLATEAGGLVSVAGDIAGPMAEFAITARLDGDALRWETLDIDRLDGVVRVADSALELETMTVRMAGGGHDGVW